MPSFSGNLPFKNYDISQEISLERLSNYTEDLERLKSSQKMLLPIIGVICALLAGLGAFFYVLYGINIVLLISFAIFASLFYGVLLYLLFKIKINSVEITISNIKSSLQNYTLLGEQIPSQEDNSDSTRLATSLSETGSEGVDRTDIPRVTRDDSYYKKIIAINVANLEKNYNLIESQASKSFVLSLVFGSIGFIFFIVALGIGYTNASNSSIPGISYLATAAGIVTEIITAIFISIYKQSTNSLEHYHDSLIDTQNALLSLEIIKECENEDHRVKIREKVVDALLQKREKTKS